MPASRIESGPRNQGFFRFGSFPRSCCWIGKDLYRFQAQELVCPNTAGTYGLDVKKGFLARTLP
jgi:hypothetical protein